MTVGSLSLEQIKENCEKRKKRMGASCWVDCPFEKVFKASPCPFKWASEDMEREVDE